jgi:hypothetical protein
MAAAGSLLKEKGDEFDELKSLLLQVDQSLGVSQLLLMCTLSNFTLSKRQEMLDRSHIHEPLEEILLCSPLVKGKLFRLPLGKLQEEVSKTPQTVKVDVQWTEKSHYFSVPFRNFTSTTGKKDRGKSIVSNGPPPPSVQPPDEEEFFSNSFSSYSSGSQISPLSESVATDHFRQVGSFSTAGGGGGGSGTSVPESTSIVISSSDHVSDEGPRQESLASRRGSHSSAERCCRIREPSSYSRFLFPPFSCTKEKWQNETCDRPLRPESASNSAAFQDGDQQIYQGFN